MSARTRPSPCRRRSALLLAAVLPAALAAARPARASDEAVRVTCPDLSTERAAELESRVRANLLTTELAATVMIACRPDRTDVTVNSAPDSVTVQVPSGSADTFRDDVLHGVEEALRELARRRASAPGASSEPTSIEPTPATSGERAPSLPAAAPPPPKAPAATRPPSAPPQRRAGRAWTELSAAALGEAWSDSVAVGAALGVARSSGALWYGARAAVLVPTAASAGFSAAEYWAALELGFQPAFAAGIRVTLGVGPSVLFVAPHATLTTRNSAATSALFFDAAVSRPFWFGRFAIVPSAGARLFTRERGVRIDAKERLKLSGLVPQLSLSAALRFE